MRRPEIDPVGLWSLKWVVAPLAVVGIIWFCINLELGKRKCQKLAKEQGYLESMYIPGKGGMMDECVCRKKQNADGTVDEHATRSFKID